MVCCDWLILEIECCKLFLFCNVCEIVVILVYDVKLIYDVLIVYYKEGLDNEVLVVFGIKGVLVLVLDCWEGIFQVVVNLEGDVKIVIVGKYMVFKDVYKLLIEVFVYGGIVNWVKVDLEWIELEIFEKEDFSFYLEGVYGILVLGGFGECGVEGKIVVVYYVCMWDIFYFGICFGMQMVVVEVVCSFVGIIEVSFIEFGLVKELVVGLMMEWIKGNVKEMCVVDGDLGGIMCFGVYLVVFQGGFKIVQIYGLISIFECYWYWYEVNIDYWE